MNSPPPEQEYTITLNSPPKNSPFTAQLIEQSQTPEEKEEENHISTDLHDLETLIEDADQLQKKISINSVLLEKLKTQLISLKLQYAEN